MGDDTIEEFIGATRIEEITILLPNQSSNKGSRKRIVGATEKLMGGKK